MMWSLAVALAACGGKELDSEAPIAPGTDTESSDRDSGESAAVEGLRVEVWPSAESADVDECETFCATVRVSRDGLPVANAEVDVWLGFDGVGFDLTTDDEGRAEACTTGLVVGEHALIATAVESSDEAQAETALRVQPFGYADGIVRDPVPLESLPYVPDFARSEANPVLSPGPEGAFDSGGAMLPSVVKTELGWTMWYAGTTAEDYTVGVATSTDGESWESALTPALPPSGEEGSWKRFATNSPMVVRADGEWRVYYTGRADETGNLTIGLATGDDSTAVSDSPDNPVFEWTEDEQSWAGTAVAHPAVVQHPDGHWEMVYSTGYHKLGHAHSLDGRTWKRYCNNPVFTGRGGGSWEDSLIKSADVRVHNGLYLMTYTGGDRGNFKVGFAMSRDGLHWVRHSTPVLGSEPTPGTWESGAVLGGAIAIDGGALRMWYAGTGLTGSAIGLAIADLPASWETP
jgi:hypothetical protein